MIHLTSKQKTIRTIVSMLCAMVLYSCVQPPVFNSKDHALIKSNYPIVAVNGSDIEETYQLDIKAGENSLVVVYNTYQYDYFCTFSWFAKADTAYEITDQENLHPLTLYRWHRKNSMWAIRLDPVDPQTCTQKPQ